ncbi:hypothetical protein H1P_2600002 [Hyella patelloides LEGE 07179]|uniref:Uncharacterized protein n=1 Tax=Hyella patelloides LEGE 07179 TaxID=945734 RepID=A0A563VSG0_9CYAN|nr:hypothetical protein [Hyella patelloides]VEP14390.1 hypothetical protein H1P_2600002 [Hyella patelloides LEGE 07179]
MYGDRASELCKLNVDRLIEVIAVHQTVRSMQALHWGVNDPASHQVG